MFELIGGIDLNTFKDLNDIKDVEMIGPIGHKQNPSIYGVLFKTDKGLLFQKHKWGHVNKSKKLPKVCAETIYSYKFVTEDIYDSFKILETPEYTRRYINDMQSIS